MTTEKRIRYLLASIALFLIIGILMSFKLWLSERFFPHTPVGGFFPVFPTPVDFILLALFLGGLLWTIFRPKIIILRLTLLILLLILLQDQMRWQPWIFMYVLMLIPFAWVDFSKSKKGSTLHLTTIQLVLIGMYLWGGLHKFTPSFFELTFPAILTGLFKISNESLVSQLSWLGFIVPVMEVLVGFGLIFRKTRKLCVLLGIATHLFILAYLSPLGINHNTVVYPWNVALMIFVYLAFYNYDKKIEFWPKQHRPVIAFTVLFAWIMPALNIADKWDHYFSFNLYTGNMEDLYIALPEMEYSQLPGPIKPYGFNIQGQEGVTHINVSRWSFDELNVPVIPQTRVLQLISRGFCDYLNDPQNATFLEYTRGKEPRTLKRQYNCGDLMD